MRKRLAWVFVALAVMLAVGFLVPLGRSVSSQARLRSLAGAQSDARGVATALAATARSTGRTPLTEDVEFVLDSFDSPDLMVILSNGTVLGSNIPVVEALELATAGSVVAEVDGGVAAIVPIAFGSGDLIVVTAFVSNEDLTEGVSTAWAILAVLGVLVIIGSVPIADRFALSIVRPMRDLSDAAHRWAGGDLTARVSPSGPAEVAESARAFNQLAERLTDLLVAERERVADLSHRLRTPLAALRLQAESTDDADQRAALITDIVHMEGEVTALIEDVRGTSTDASTVCDLTAVVGQRLGFWSIVAAAQDREMTQTLPADTRIPIKLTAADLLAVLDNLVQNVLTHTEAGTAFCVRVTADPPTLTVADEGGGLPSIRVFDRGASGSSSSGLGLDIVRSIAEKSGGAVTLGEALGASIVVWFGEPDSPVDPEETT
nr:HAMP domain-containing histidine kinase [Actinomycetota bacterium]